MHGSTKLKFSSSASLQIYNTVYEPRLLVLIPSQINQFHVRLPTSSVSILISSSHLLLGLPSVLFPTVLHTKTLYATLLSFIRATSPANLIFLVCITRIILCYQYRQLANRHSHSSLTSCLFQLSYSVTYSHCHRPRFTLIQTTSIITFVSNYS